MLSQTQSPSQSWKTQSYVKVPRWLIRSNGLVQVITFCFLNVNLSSSRTVLIILVSSGTVVHFILRSQKAPLAKYFIMTWGEALKQVIYHNSWFLYSCTSFLREQSTGYPRSSSTSCSPAGCQAVLGLQQPEPERSHSAVLATLQQWWQQWDAHPRSPSTKFEFDQCLQESSRIKEYRQPVQCPTQQGSYVGRDEKPKQ